MNYIKTVSLSGGAMEAGVIGQNLMTQSLVEMEIEQEKGAALEAQKESNKAVADTTEDALHDQATSQRNNGIGSIANGSIGLAGEVYAAKGEYQAAKDPKLAESTATLKRVNTWEEEVKGSGKGQIFAKSSEPVDELRKRATNLGNEANKAEKVASDLERKAKTAIVNKSTIEAQAKAARISADNANVQAKNAKALVVDSEQTTLTNAIERIKGIDVTARDFNADDKKAIEIVKASKDPTKKDCLDGLDKQISKQIEKAEGAINTHNQRSERRAERQRRTFGFMGSLAQGSAQMAAAVATDAQAAAEMDKVKATYVKDAYTSAITSDDKALDTASQSKQSSIQTDAAIIQANAV